MEPATFPFGTRAIHRPALALLDGISMIHKLITSQCAQLILLAPGRHPLWLTCKIKYIDCLQLRSTFCNRYVLCRNGAPPPCA